MTVSGAMQRGAVIGTGIMGAPMARRLAAAGYDIAGWNRSAHKLHALAEAGVAIRDTPQAAVEERDFVISMLSSGPVNQAVLLGNDGVIAGMRPGTHLVIMSSIPVDTAREIAAVAAGHDIFCLDAPVSGGEKGAIEGTLSIMAGGSPSAFKAMAAVFCVLGRPTHIGPSGSGQLAKLCNQMIVASTICAVAEGLLLAEKGGADPARVREALMGGFADSTILHQHGARMINRRFDPGGPAKYQVKDTTAALELAKTLGLDLPVGRIVDTLFSEMVGAGDGDLDHSAVIDLIRHRSE